MFLPQGLCACHSAYLENPRTLGIHSETSSDVTSERTLTSRFKVVPPSRPWHFPFLFQIELLTSWGLLCLMVLMYLACNSLAPGTLCLISHCKSSTTRAMPRAALGGSLFVRWPEYKPAEVWMVHHIIINPIASLQVKFLLSKGSLLSTPPTLLCPSVPGGFSRCGVSCVCCVGCCTHPTHTEIFPLCPVPMKA